MVLIAFITPLIFALSMSAVACVVKPHGCKINNLKITVPSALPAPTTSLSYVSVAFGTQNYTCFPAGNYTSVGAVAELFDISCLKRTKLFSTIQDDLLTLWKKAPDTITIEQVVQKLGQSNSWPAKASYNLGQHYFIPNPSGVGLSPKWDFTSFGDNQGDPEAFFVGTRLAGAPAPTGPQDIDWLVLKLVSGSLATQVYRTDTRGGQPPPSCVPGSSPEIQVKYTSKYLFYGSS